MNAKRDSSRFVSRLLLVIIAVVFMVFGARYCATTLNPRSGPVNVTVIVPPTPLSPSDAPVQVAIGPIEIVSAVADVECGPNGKVISATMTIQVTGGIAPYDLEFDPSDTIIPGLEAGSIIKFTLPAGHSLTAQVRSHSADGTPSGTRTIRAPSKDGRCAEPTSAVLPSATMTNSPIPTKAATYTKSHDPRATKTMILSSTSTHASIDKTNTPPLPTVKTNTPLSPVVKTNTPPSPVVKTDTPPSPVVKTNTPPSPVVKTHTPLVPTLTPVLPPVAECEDGRDNDGDTFIDAYDPQCKGTNDNHEEK